MQHRKAKTDLERHDAEVSAPPALRLAAEGDRHASSPALALQQSLVEDWPLQGSVADDGRRWAPGMTLLVSGGISLLLWGAVAFAVLALR